MLWLLDLDFCWDWKDKNQWLLTDPLRGFVGSQTQTNPEEVFPGGTTIATGNPVCLFGSLGKIFTCLFLPVVKRYQSEFGWVGWFAFLKKWWYVLKTEVMGWSVILQSDAAGGLLPESHRDLRGAAEGSCAAAIAP